MSFYLPTHPYPPPRYTELVGTRSAWWRRRDAAHDIDYASGGSCDYLATGAATHGDYGLYRWNMAPRKNGPDPHFHRAVTESFFVLEGTVQIYDGSGWTEARVGDFCFVAEGGVHGFRNQSDEPSSMLILFSPGAPREGYFEGLADIAATGVRPSGEVMTEFYAAHDTYWVSDARD